MRILVYIMTTPIIKLSSFDIVKRRNRSPKKTDPKPITKLSSFNTVKRRHSGNAELFTLGQDLHIVVDRSSSMQSMEDAPANQIRALLIDQKKIADDTGKTIRVTLTVFDDVAETYMENVDISTYDIPQIDWFQDVLKPRGCTRFYDTMIECLANQRSRVNNWDVSPKLRKLNPIINRTIYVLTDGYDNRSGLSITNLRSAMKTNKLVGSFNAVFLAANLGNAQEIGASMGFNPNTSLTIDAGRQRSSNGMQAANSLLRAISSGSSAPPGFTQLQRQSSQPVDHITAPTNLRIRRTRNAIPVGISSTSPPSSPSFLPCLSRC